MYFPTVAPLRCSGSGSGCRACRLLRLSPAGTTPGRQCSSPPCAMSSSASRSSIGLLKRSFESNAQARRTIRFSSGLPCSGAGSGSPLMRRCSALLLLSAVGTSGGANGIRRSFSSQYSTRPSEYWSTFAL